MTIAKLSFGAGTPRAMEGSGGGITYANFTIRRSGSLVGSVSVDWSLVGIDGAVGLAADDADFAALAGTVTFSHGETSRVLSIPVRADGIVESGEGYAIVLPNPTGGAVIETNVAVASIVDDDTSFSIRRTSGRDEGTGGVTPYGFTVERAGLATLSQSVTWAVIGAGIFVPGATAEDFAGGVLPGGTLSFSPGERSKTLTVGVVADGFREEDEGFAVLLSAPTGGATLGTAVAFADITDDDPLSPPGGGTVAPATLAFAPVKSWPVEGTGSLATHIEFPILRRGSSAGSVEVDWAVMGADSDGRSAASDADFVIRSGRLSFAPGEISQILSIPVRADAMAEGAGTFVVVLSNPSGGASIEMPAYFGFILDDDTNFSIRQLHGFMQEGSGATTTEVFKIYRTSFPSYIELTQSVTWTVVGAVGSELPPATAADFAGGVFPSGTVSFVRGVNEQTVRFDVLAGMSVRRGGGYAVVLSAPTDGVTLGAQPLQGGPAALGIIAGGGFGARLSITAIDNRLAEGNGGVTPYRFSVNRTGNVTHSHSVNWAVTGESFRPVEETDFQGNVLPSGRVTFAPGETSRIITVNVVADGLVELNEEMGVVLSDPSLGAELAVAGARATIVNDDFGNTGILSVGPLRAGRGEGQGGATGFEFLVTRTGDIFGSAEAIWSVGAGTVAGTMSAVASDFVGGSLPQGVVRFAPGVASRIITIDVAGDLAREFNESFTVALSGVPSGVSLGTARSQGVIFDDDAAGSGVLSIAP